MRHVVLVPCRLCALGVVENPVAVAKVLRGVQTLAFRSFPNDFVPEPVPSKNSVQEQTEIAVRRIVAMHIEAPRRLENSTHLDHSRSHPRYESSDAICDARGYLAGGYGASFDDDRRLYEFLDRGMVGGDHVVPLVRHIVPAPAVVELLLCRPLDPSGALKLRLALKRGSVAIKSMDSLSIPRRMGRLSATKRVRLGIFIAPAPLSGTVRS